MQSNVSIHYLDSWPVYPYRTATALLISCRFDLSLHNVTSMLHLPLKRIEEVLSVTVEGQQMYSPGYRRILVFFLSFLTGMSSLQRSDSSDREHGVQGE